MKPLSRLIFSIALGFSPTLSRAESWKDPAPPTVHPVVRDAPPLPAPFERLKFHAAPAPLNGAAVTSDWHRFLGPHDDVTSPETNLLHSFPVTGPTKVWEVSKGDGYTSPAIKGDRLLLFHAEGGKEVLECLHPETGQRYWTQGYPMEYRDRYGFANGPRSSPVIAGDRVIIHGVTSMLTCVDLKTGQVLWQRNLRTEFNVPQDFFGQGSSPLVLGNKVIVNVGGKGRPAPDDDTAARYEALADPGLSVGAFDLKTGKLVWGVKDEWGASYASPVPAVLHGKQTVLVYAGGEGNPATGGLLCINPEDGTVYDRHPWRADEYIQATGTSPVVIPGQNRVFISTAYPKSRPLGGVMLEFDAQLKSKELWTSKKFAVHWMNPVYKDGCLYGIDGETERQAELVCFDVATGKENWREDLYWDDQEMSPGRTSRMGAQRASLLLVDGQCLCLGELGSLLWLDLTPQGCKITAKTQLFYAPHTWCVPAISKGLLYVMQHYDEQVRGRTGQRLICYDLRGK